MSRGVMDDQGSDSSATRQALQMLVEDGRLEESDCGRILGLMEQTEQSTCLLLDRLGFVSQDDWASTLAEVTGMRLVKLRDMPERLPGDARLSLDYLRRHHIAPLQLAHDRAEFAVSDPDDRTSLLALRLLFGNTLTLSLATERCVEAAFERSAALEREEASGVEMQSDPDASYLLELANDAPTIAYVDSLIGKAVGASATDVHVEPLEDQVRARVRVDGILVETNGPPVSLYPGILSRLKILANLDISERRRPQDGRFYHRTHGCRVDIRVSTTCTIYGEAITLRLLAEGASRGSLESLQMPDEVGASFRSALAQPNGLILITGPTGSGKTTTLHAALSELDEIGRKIITVEDPVEIRAPGLLQIEVNAGIGWSFADALRTVLRHDPDVIMIGEIRDEETAELVVQAALTGHLVLSTLHTRKASEALKRLVAMGVSEFTLKGVVQLVAAQRLVRLLCQGCKRRIAFDTPDWHSAMPQISIRSFHTLPERDQWMLMQPVGCERCNGQGFNGRFAIFDIMSADSETMDSGHNSRAGPLSMTEQALALVASGKTTFDELVRVIGPIAASVGEPQEVDAA